MAVLNEFQPESVPEAEETEKQEVYAGQYVSGNAPGFYVRTETHFLYSEMSSLSLLCRDRSNLDKHIAFLYYGLKIFKSLTHVNCPSIR